MHDQSTIARASFMSGTTSVQLISRLQASNETRSWNRFCLIYEPFIFRWLTYQGIRESDAQDIQQDVMYTVLSEISRFRHNGSVGAFRCWLRMVTVNHLRRHRRSRRRDADIDLDWLAASLSESDNEINRQFDADHDHYLLTILLGAVESDFAESTIRAFRMTAVDAIPPAEVAEQLGLTKAAVIAGKSRVLCRLRESAAQLFSGDV